MPLSPQQKARLAKLNPNIGVYMLLQQFEKEYNQRVQQLETDFTQRLEAMKREAIQTFESVKRIQKGEQGGQGEKPIAGIEKLY